MKSTSPQNKFIIFDCAHADSHVEFNSFFIAHLKEIGDIFLLSWGRSYTNLRSEKISVIKKRYLSIGSANAFIARVIYLINTLLNSFYIRMLLKLDNKKYVVIGHEIISLGLCFFLFPRGMYLIHHMQIDELRSKIKRTFFNFYKNRFIHVVMADYIKDYLVSNHNIPAKNIRVILHPLYERPTLSKKSDSQINTFIALNYSTSESFIDSLINYDINHSSFFYNGCQLVIKSKFHKYKSPGLRVFKGYLSRSEYDQFYKESDCVLSMVDRNFNYRIGGTLIDAISYGKPVIAMRSLFSEYYHSLFGKSIILCDNLDSFVDAIINFKNIKDGLYYSDALIDSYNILYGQMITQSFLDHEH
jgi:hypothetical protein